MSHRGPAPFGLVVELDGRLFHDGARARDLDLDRDLDAALDGLLTVRLGWGQVHVRPCATAARLARLLRRRGRAGTPRDCHSCPRWQRWFAVTGWLRITAVVT